MRDFVSNEPDTAAYLAHETMPADRPSLQDLACDETPGSLCDACGERPAVFADCCESCFEGEEDL